MGDDPLRESVRKRRELRETVLRAVYIETDATPAPHGRVRISVIAEKVGRSDEDVTRETLVLKDMSLIEFGAGGQVGLTAYGIETVENEVDPQDHPAQPLDLVEVRQVEAFVRELQQAIDRKELPDTVDTVEVADLLRVVESQLHGRGRRPIVRAVLRVIGHLLVGMGGNFATELAKRIPQLL